MKAIVRFEMTLETVNCQVIGIEGYLTEMFIAFMLPGTGRSIEYAIAEYTTGRIVSAGFDTLDKVLANAKRRLDIGVHDLNEIKGFWPVVNQTKAYGYA